MRRERDGTETGRVEVPVEDSNRWNVVPNAEGSAALVFTRGPGLMPPPWRTYLLRFEDASVSSVDDLARDVGCAPLVAESRVGWLPSGREFFVECDDSTLRSTLAGVTTSADFRYVGTLPDGRFLGRGRDDRIAFVSATESGKMSCRLRTPVVSCSPTPAEARASSSSSTSPPSGSAALGGGIAQTALLRCAEDAWLIEPSGRSRPVLPDADAFGYEGFGPDGCELLVDEVSGTSVSWILMDTVSGELTPLDVPEDTLRVAWSQQPWEPDCLTRICW